MTNKAHRSKGNSSRNKRRSESHALFGRRGGGHFPGKGLLGNRHQAELRREGHLQQMSERQRELVE